MYENIRKSRRKKPPVGRWYFVTTEYFSARSPKISLRYCALGIGIYKLRFVFATFLLLIYLFIFSSPLLRLCCHHHLDPRLLLPALPRKSVEEWTIERQDWLHGMLLIIIRCSLGICPAESRMMMCETCFPVSTIRKISFTIVYLDAFHFRVGFNFVTFAHRQTFAKINPQKEIVWTLATTPNIFFSSAWALAQVRWGFVVSLVYKRKQRRWKVTEKIGSLRR